MLLDKFVKVKKNNNNYKYYNNLGYSLNEENFYTVDIINLPKSSKINIRVKCDYCKNVKITEYRLYILSIKNGGKYACCNKCAYVKNIKTNIEKYGVEHTGSIKEFIDKKEKTNIEKYGNKCSLFNNVVKQKKMESMLEKYGVDTPIKNVDIKNKIRETNLKKYNVDTPIKNVDIKNKIKETNLKKYGVKNVFQSDNIKTLIKEKLFKNKKEKYKKLLNINDYELLEYSNIIKIKHNVCKCVFTINNINLLNRMKYDICLCTECYPISEQTSVKEKELVDYVKSLNVDLIEGDREILNGKELDIYLPSKNLAIEFNGLYWHSEFYKDENYHLEKSLKCQEKGIQLLHIWEDEWILKQDIVKSIILNRLGLIKNKIYARQCEIKIVQDSKLIQHFLNENHIQGYSQSSIKIGLYYKNELISLMTFGERKIKKNIEFELIRFCNKINLNVVGAASKLFNYFKQNFQFNELISYSDFRLFDGKMYETLGFEKKHLSIPEYFWCKDIIRKHRFNFNKQKLIKEGYDKNKTEIQIMHERGYYRIFGCGQIKWYFFK
jgi:hypothetical protein